MPVTRFLVRRPPAAGGITVRLRRRRPAVGRRSASSTATAPTSPRTPSARSSACSTARTSAGCSPARSATSASRRGPSSTTPPRSRPRSTSRPIREPPVQGRARLRATARRRSSCRTCWPSSAPTCWRSTRTPRPAGRARLRPRRRTPSDVADLVRASGAHLGAVHRPRRRAPHAHRRRGPRAHRHRGRCWRFVDARVRPPARRPHRPAGAVSQARRAICARRTASSVLYTKLSTPALMDAASRAGRRLRRQRRRRLHPPGLPARLRRRRHVGEAARPAGPQRGAARRRSSPSLPARAHRPRDGRDAVGAEGRRDAHAGRAEQGPRARARRRRQGASTTTAGRSRCPTPRSRSPTSGPRAPPTPRPAAWPRSTPGASARCCAERRDRGSPRPSA